MRYTLLLFFVPSLAIAAGPQPDDGVFVPMFNGRDLSGWVPVNVARSTFTVRDGLIVCTGKPTGFMRTEKQYENFIVELEWRQITPGGNSGFFIWGDPVPAVGAPYTRGIEVQILDGHESPFWTSQGDVFPIWGATLRPDNPRGEKNPRAYPTESRTRPAPEWNHYRVECSDGNVTLSVNGKVVTTAHDATPRKGYLCLESEGGVIHFRNLRIKELPPSSPPLDLKLVAEPDGGFKSLYTGQDLTGWQGEKGGGHWHPSDWTMWTDGKGTTEQQTLWTRRELGDHELILDYRTERKDAEARVVLFPRGPAGPFITLGPGSPGSHEPGSWNRVALTIRGGRVSASQNRQPLPDVAPLPAKTAPLGLHATTQTQFANIFIRLLE